MADNKDSSLAGASEIELAKKSLEALGGDDSTVSENLEESVLDVDFDDGEEGDAFLMYLTNEYRKYRIWTLVLAIIGFSLILLTIGLQQNGVISVNIYNLMMSIANLFIVLMLVLVFTRTRPFRKKVRSYDKNYVSIIDHDAPDGVRIEERDFPDMDDFYLIFERKVRTELIPETEEYRQLRKTWLTLYAIAAVALIVSLVLYFLVPSASLFTTFILLAAFVLVVVAFYFDRTKMRPLRKDWAREHYGMSEFQARDRMK